MRRLYEIEKKKVEFFSNRIAKMHQELRHKATLVMSLRSQLKPQGNSAMNEVAVPKDSHPSESRPKNSDPSVPRPKDASPSNSRLKKPKLSEGIVMRTPEKCKRVEKKYDFRNGEIPMFDFRKNLLGKVAETGNDVKNMADSKKH